MTSNRGKGNFSLLPNGVFYITHDNRARILDTNRFDQRFHQGYADIRDAVQSGPMLLIDGEYNPYFLPKSDSYRIRSGVCALNHGQKVVFVVTEDSVNFYEFARFLKSSSIAKMRSILMERLRESIIKAMFMVHLFGKQSRLWAYGLSVKSIIKYYGHEIS